MMQAKRSRKAGAVPSRVRLAVTLRFLAGGQVLDMSLIYNISKVECYHSMWRTIDAINALPELAVYFPIDDKSKLQEIEIEFAKAHERRYKSMSWRGQVGAIDGIDFKQTNPGNNIKNSKRYYVQRKGGHQLLCVAICDSFRRFMCYELSKEAASHDSLAWEAMDLAIKISKGGLPSPFFLNGDNAFASSNTMVTPANDSDFDFYQSSNRMAIECAFGMLVRRFGVFWRPLGVKFKRRAPLIGATIRLHNYCINRRIGIELRERNGQSEIQPHVWMPTPNFDSNGAPVDFLDTADHSAAPSTGKNSTRDRLKADLRSCGLKRPRESSYTQACRDRKLRAKQAATSSSSS
jgi:hypothetical protein